MAKKFMFVCVGVLALTIAFLMGAQFGRAEYVDHSTTGIVSGTAYNGNSQYVLMDNGQIWSFDIASLTWSPGWWALLPIPPSQIKVWCYLPQAYHWFVSDDNEVWVWRAEGWVTAGSPPGGVATQPTTWGQIKAQFKD